jgi:hypothetical protein
MRNRPVALSLVIVMAALCAAGALGAAGPAGAGRAATSTGQRMPRAPGGDLGATRPLTPSELLFTPDSGLRMTNASNPRASVSVTGLVYLFYEDHSVVPSRPMIATALDGLTFGPGRERVQADNAYDPFRVHLPDGAWRNYLTQPPPQTNLVLSESGADGIHFTQDPGVRYTAVVSDNNTIGVHDEYVAPDGGVALLYVGDLYGLNNVRRAVSTDMGWTFAFEDGNVLGDAGGGGGPNSFVDEKSTALPDGRRRLFVMRQGTIYSFTTVDGYHYAQDPGVRARPSDYAALTLHDPAVVRLPDGRYRMYVAEQTSPGVFSLVSATSGVEWRAWLPAIVR